MRSSDEIASHPLVKQLLDDMGPVFERITPTLENRNGRRQKHPVDVSPSEHYTWQTFGKALAIHDTARRLEHAKGLVRLYPSPKDFESIGITRDKWVEYHLCYFIINLASIPDLCLLLTNTVFKLGMPERLCTLESIIKNDWVAETEVPKALRNLDKVVEEHRTLRNLHVHRGQVPKVSDLLDDDLFSYLSFITFAEKISNIELDPHILPQGYRTATNDLSRKMEGYFCTVLDAIIIVLNELQPQYLKVLTRIRNGGYL